MATLKRAERAASAHSAGEVHAQLRPLLREIAEQRLRSRGLDLDQPAARELLGEELWELVRPGRRPPDDRLADAMTRPRLAAVLDRLETL